jgi:hypothetical protein
MISFLGMMRCYQWSILLQGIEKPRDILFLFPSQLSDILWNIYLLLLYLVHYINIGFYTSAFNMSVLLYKANTVRVNGCASHPCLSQFSMGVLMLLCVLCSDPPPSKWELSLSMNMEHIHHSNNDSLLKKYRRKSSMIRPSWACLVVLYRTVNELHLC